MAPQHSHSQQTAIVRWWMPTFVGALFLSVGFIVFECFLGIFFVPTNSMSPTIQPGDRIVVNRLTYGLRWPFQKIYSFRWGLPQEGDVVVFQSPWDPQKTFVKRVVRNEISPVTDHTTQRIPPGFVFCEGDNREESFDSRSWGLVSIELIYGKVVLVLFSTQVSETWTLPQFRVNRWFTPVSSTQTTKP